MRLCVISGAAAKRALTLHCGRRAQALSRVDVPRTQAVEFGSKPGAINLFVYMQLAPPQRGKHFAAIHVGELPAEHRDIERRLRR